MRNEHGKQGFGPMLPGCPRPVDRAVRPAP
jgi:hypothetical protein